MSAPAIAMGPSARANRNRARMRADRAPVRRNSRPSEDADRFYRPLSKAQRDHIVKVCVLYSEAHRESGVAPLTPSAIHVLRTMIYDLMDWNTGVLDDAYDWIAIKAKRAYQTVVDAIAAMQAEGVLEKMRRCRRNEDGEGPPWVQDTNAYRFDLPAKYATWWAARKAAREARRRERTVPDDQAQASAAAEAANTAAEAEWLVMESEKAKAAWRAQERARDIRGPGAGAYRARLEGT